MKEREKERGRERDSKERKRERKAERERKTEREGKKDRKRERKKGNLTRMWVREGLSLSVCLSVLSVCLLRMNRSSKSSVHPSFSS